MILLAMIAAIYFFMGLKVAFGFVVALIIVGALS